VNLWETPCGVSDFFNENYRQIIGETPCGVSVFKQKLSSIYSSIIVNFFPEIIVNFLYKFSTISF